jgi:hypothetical protein
MTKNIAIALLVISSIAAIARVEAAVVNFVVAQVSTTLEVK